MKLRVLPTSQYSDCSPIEDPQPDESTQRECKKSFENSNKIAILIHVSCQTNPNDALFHTSPKRTHISWMTSVYATEYNPPKSVYVTATAAEIMMERVLSSPNITVHIDPGDISQTIKLTCLK